MQIEIEEKCWVGNDKDGKEIYGRRFITLDIEDIDYDTNKIKTWDDFEGEALNSEVVSAKLY